ncbi:MAG: hypothetical protein JSR87_09770 [Proteobacteria bacterium]|nr:hypothetical protein [Pseudomonadota bacterium]MBS0571681.1 hypothetical protein [Pseudomonadota bacterium]
MVDKEDLKRWVLDALHSEGGSSSLIEVAKHIWEHHEAELRRSGDLFFKWQYDMRWAATALRNEGKMGAGWTLKQ